VAEVEVGVRVWKGRCDYRSLVAEFIHLGSRQSAR
jgi:hypothetical protein